MKKLTTLMLICAMLISGSAMAESLGSGYSASLASPSPTVTEASSENSPPTDAESSNEVPSANSAVTDAESSTEAPSENSTPTDAESSTLTNAESSTEATEFSFRDGITWNSTADEIMQLTGAVPPEGELMALYSHISDVYTANDVAVARTTADALDFFFYEGTPFVISYSFRDSAENIELYEKLQNGLTLKYGDPIGADATASFNVMESLLSHEAVELPLQLGPVSIGPWHIGSVSIGKSESIEALALEKYCAWTCADTRIYLALEGSDLVIRYENLPAIATRAEAISAANAATAIDGL